MPRHRGGRRRSGRQSPYRSRAPAGQARATGFTRPGFRQFYDVLTRWRRGRQRRAFFNLAGGWLVLMAGLSGALMGSDGLRWPGLVVRLGLGAAAAGTRATRARFDRP